VDLMVPGDRGRGPSSATRTAPRDRDRDGAPADPAHGERRRPAGAMLGL